MHEAPIEGTKAEIRALAFGDKIIGLQAGMLARVQRTLDAVTRLESAGGNPTALCQAGERQIADYQRRAAVMMNRHAVLIALAERAKAGALQ